MVSVEYSEAICEVLDILYNSDEEVVNKIPKKLIQFWEENKSTTYVPNLNHELSINEMNIKSKTRAVIAMIYLNYLCDEEEKEKTREILANNEKIYQAELKKKYNPDNIFNNKTKTEKVEQNKNEKKTEKNEQINESKLNQKQENPQTKEIQVIDTDKQNYWTRIKNFIKKFFK